MDINVFNPARSPGQLVRIEADEQAFLPDPLPPHGLHLSADTRDLLAEAREQIAVVRGLTDPLNLPDPGILLRPLQLEESLRSSSLEGTHADDQELLFYELDPSDLGQDERARSVREVANLRQALQLAAGLHSQRAIRLNDIRELHQTLLRNVRGEDKQPGHFRSIQVYIGTDHRFIPPPAHHVTEGMEELARYCEHPDDKLPALVRALLVHYQFEAIHPFRDGNGRVGRALLTLMIAQASQLSAPWIHLSAFLEDHREEYMQSLFDVSAKGDWERWLNLGLRAAAHQARDAADRCRQLLALRREWTDMIRASGLKARTIALLDHLLSLPVIDVETARRLLQVRTYPTARADLERMVELGMIEPIPNRYPLTFSAPRVSRIVFRKQQAS